MISFASLISADSVHNNPVGEAKYADTNTNSSPQQNIGLHIQRKGDISGVEKSLGAKLQQFLYWMDSKDITSDVASRAQSSIDAL